MAQISLHDYLQQINILLEENRLSEAVAHCRHILKKFPRHVETYRLYGKALLEQQKFSEAVDIFQRVLSADPEDFISHVGLAITHKEKGEVPQAIWHFERAFEMDPYNAAIQEELRGLYAHRDGLRPERINLTRGALARLYFRGNLYQQAAAELRQILSQNGERLDLQALLAETLWRDDQRVDVVDVCLRILDKTPYCIKANAILAEVWLVTGRSDEAQEYLQRLRMLTRPEKAYLDPDSVVGRAFSTNGQIELPERVLIEELDYIPMAQELSGETDWVKELGVETEEDEEANWLHELGEMDVNAFAEAAASDEDMLDWLREVAVSDEEPLDESEPDGTTDTLFDLEDEPPQAAFEDAPDNTLDWLSEGDEADEESAAEMPDWLSEVTALADADIWNMAIEADEEPGEAAEDDSTPLPQSGAAKAQTPDWIRDVAQDNVDMSPIPAWQEEDQHQDWMSAPEMTGEFDEGDEIPDWMRGGSAADFPDWLNESDEATTAEAEELPDWLTQPEENALSGDKFPDFSVEDPVYGLTGEQIPDWLLGSAESLDAEGEPAFDADFELENEGAFEATFDSDFDEVSEEPAETAAYEAGMGDLPDWLVAAQAAGDTEEAADLEEIPDWLKAEVQSGEEAVTLDFDFEAAGLGSELEAEAGEPVDETADWLADFEQVEQGSETFPEWMEASPELIVGPTDIDQGSLPDWLDGGEQEDAVREEMLMGNSEEQEKKEPDIPEDLDEAMKWLEELAAEQGADLAELPSLQEKTSSKEEMAEQTGVVNDDDVPDWLKGDLSDGDLSAEEDLPDWLQDEAGALSDVDWLALSDEAELPELDRTIFEAEDAGAGSLAQPGDDIPDWLKAQMPEDLGSSMEAEPELDDDLGWLDQIAAGEGAAIEELPTLSWDEDRDDAGLEGGDLSWLADMAEESAVFEAAAEPEEAGLYDFMGEQEDAVSTQVPDDPDEAMAWLEQLAAQQGAPLDELPTIQDEIPLMAEAEEAAVSEVDQDAPTVFDLPEQGEFEVSPGLDMPDDPDEAMAWLEQLAARQGAPLDELPTMADFGEAPEAADLPEMDFSETPTVIDIPEAAEIEAEAELPAFDIPDDPDEAMAWLEQLAAQQGAPLEELPTVNVVEEMPTPVTGIATEDEEFEAAFESADFEPTDFEPEDLETAEFETADYELAVSEDDFDPELELALAELSDIDMPEDDDEALAWLAVITTGELTEPGAVESVEAVSAEAEMAEALSSEDFSFEEPETVYEQPDEGSLFDAIEDQTDQFIELDDELPLNLDSEIEDSELDSALPDWLQFGPVGDTSQEELDWLDSFGESDVDSWLEAEEQTTQMEMELPTDTAELDPAAFREPAAAELDFFEEETFEVEAVSSGPVDQSQLESARSALEIGDYSTALEQYGLLLQSGQGLPLLIADLETASNRHSNIAPLQRLLGDAYMQNGQLQKAIDTYRQALDNI